MSNSWNTIDHDFSLENTTFPAFYVLEYKFDIFIMFQVIPQIVDVVPTLPDIPLPAIQPNYRPLPSIDVTPLSPQRRKGWGL